MLTINEEEYKRHLIYAKRITKGREPEELLHEVYLKVIEKDIKPSKDAYINRALRNTFYDVNSDYRKLINPRPVIFDLEQNDLPDTNHIFRTLHEMRLEGKGKHADRFLQNYFSDMNQKELSKKEGVSVQMITKSCKIVKTEIRNRYELD